MPLISTLPTRPTTSFPYVNVNATAAMIHNAAFAQVQKYVHWFKTYKQTPMIVVQPEDLPRLSVFFMRETEVKDGVGPAGEPHFRAELQLGFVGSIVSSDDANQLLQLQMNMRAIRWSLFSDPLFRQQNGIEDYVGSETRYAFQKIGETPLAEISTEITFTYRTDYPPTIPDDLKQIVVYPIEGPDLENAGEPYPYLQPRVYDIPSEDDTPIPPPPMSGDT